MLTRLSSPGRATARENLCAGPHARGGADLWAWLAEGAHFYVCGDAKRMAKDVEAALIEIAAEHGEWTRGRGISSAT